jgi:ribosomal protein S18 acetylase RimI-like enzyme
MKIEFSDSFINLKSAKLSDIPYCYQLSKRNMKRYKSEKRVYQQYKDEFIATDVKVVWYKGRRFGFVEFQNKQDDWYIWDMQLSRILQGKGLGSQLLEYILEEVEKQKGKVVKLFVYTNNPVVEMYKKFGFKTIIKKSSPERLQMQKIIN